MACLNIKRYDRQTVFFAGSVQSSLPNVRKNKTRIIPFYSQTFTLIALKNARPANQGRVMKPLYRSVAVAGITRQQDRRLCQSPQERDAE
jgi:hypothetical protein